MPWTRRSELTRCAVQDLPCPVRIPIRFNDAAMSSSDHREAMLRITARASSGVRQPCSPDFGLRTRSCECWPPRQWTVRMTSRVLVDVGDDIRDAGAQKLLAGAH